MVNKEVMDAANAWFDEADRLWKRLRDADTPEQFRRLAGEHAEATMRGLALLEQATKEVGVGQEKVVVGLA